MKPDPNKVYGEVPQSFSHRVEYALRRCEKEEATSMKRKPVMAILITVLCLALTTTAVAAALSKTTEFFVSEYGEHIRETMESGVVVPLDQSTTFSGAVFTLYDAVITPGKTEWLYGVGDVNPPADTLDFWATGVITPAGDENIVLLAWDEYTVDDPAGYALYYANRPKAPEGAPTYAELAREKGATIRKVSCTGSGIINEANGEIYLNTIGATIIPLEDGSVHFSVEVPGEHIYPVQDSYRLALEIMTEDIDLSGNPIEGTRQSTDWIVTLTPEKEK